MKKLFLKNIAPIEISILQTNYLKGIGILLILFHNFLHWVQPNTGENEFDFWNQRVVQFFDFLGDNPSEFINILFSYLGHYGVQIFIFISGYGLTKSYLARKTSWGFFIKHRVKKIYPSLIVGILVLVLYSVLTGYSHQLNAYWLHSISYKLLLINTLIPGEALSINGPWWFYGLIFQLYVLFPLVFKVIQKWGVKGFVLTLVLSYAFIFTFFSKFNDMGIALMANAFGHIPEFALGIFLALNPKLKIKRYWLYLAIIVFVLGNYKFEGYPFTFIAITFISLLAILAITRNRLTNEKKNWIVRYGQLSMFVFAVHGFFRPPFADLANKADNAFVTILYALLFFITITGVALASEVGYNKVVVFINRINAFFIRLQRNILIHKFKLRDTLTLLLRNWFVAVLGIILIRIMMVLWFNMEFSIDKTDFHHLYTGLFREIMVMSRLTAFLVLPFLIIGKWMKPLFAILSNTFFIGFLLITGGLSYYYLNMQIPLDEVILFFSFAEAVKIISISGGFNLWSILFLVLPIILYISLNTILKRQTLSNALWLVILIGLVINPSLLTPNAKEYSKDSYHHKAISYGAYLVDEVKQSKKENRKNADLNYREVISDYQATHNTLDYTSNIYPFVHNTVYEDVLSDYFYAFDTKPNLVFIIVESLGSAYSGTEAKALSVTPFIDSLCDHSLYWPNCLSSSDRTFGALPGIFSSFLSFTDMRYNMPSHYSLPQKLDSLGYKNSFYYGGDPYFDGMEQFMKINKVALPIVNTDLNLGVKSENPDNNWGWNDQLLFQNRIEQNPIEDSVPFLDIYLTITSHSPFKYPNSDEWKQRLIEYVSIYENLDQLPYDYINHADRFASIHYTDNALRSIFEAYKKSGTWNNTVFIITGDHHIGGMPLISTLDRCNVPLLIFSPKIKESKVFPSLVSHFDLTPSLLSFIGTQTNTKQSNIAHWLGTGLDTSSTFNAKKKFSMMRYSREIVDYISEDHCLSNGRLYTISDNLILTQLKDTVIEQQMANELQNQKDLYYLALRQNRLLPEKYQLGRENVKVARHIKADFEDENSIPKDFGDNCLTEDNPVDGDVSAYLPAEVMYGSLVPHYQFSEDFSQIEVRLSFDYISNANILENLPTVVFQIMDKNGGVWSSSHQLNSSSDFDAGDGVFQFTRNEIYRPDYTTSWKTFKVYLFNPDKESITYDNISYELVLIP